ncbi:MAG TPA: HAMP domain-containing sensor histidine kinase [Spirochaetales bacterium]|nr:HAMP domain-containing sensor histidine kinase [Spirochaetales bacterium]
MKIRSQFYILVFGIVVVPLLAFAGLLAMQGGRESSVVQVPGYDEVAALAGGSFDRASWERLADYMAHKPPTMEFTVLDPERRVAFSTISGHKVGDLVSDEALLGYMRETSGDYFYQIDSPVRSSDGGLLVLTRIERSERLRPPNPFSRFFSSFAVLLAALFLFSAGMAVLIARSITQSVLALDAATRRIAAGELERNVEVRGSNEITSLASSLNAMRLALKDDLARRSRFIMGVTHDLKTPLALIKGYAEAIGDGMDDGADTRERYVGIIGSKVDQLAGMIDDLIDFVRVDSGEWRERLERAPLAPFLRGLCRRLEEDAVLLGRRAESSIALPDDLAVPFDERLITRALENIVNNALRYTEPGGLVRVAAWLERGADGGDRVAIEVSDDGPGIGEGELPLIFDPFYRGSGSRREQGMGLGLSVVKGVVESHGWELSVRSRPGEGSAFRIDAPLR